MLCSLSKESTVITTDRKIGLILWFFFSFIYFPDEFVQNASLAYLKLLLQPLKYKLVLLSKNYISTYIQSRIWSYDRNRRNRNIEQCSHKIFLTIMISITSFFFFFFSHTSFWIDIVIWRQRCMKSYILFCYPNNMMFSLCMCLYKYFFTLIWIYVGNIISN